MRDADADAKVIEALIANGSDVSKPHEIDFLFYFHRLAPSRTASSALEQGGFTGTTIREHSDEEFTYTVECQRTLVPAIETMRTLSKNFTAMATELGGRYDGWGTEIVERS